MIKYKTVFAHTLSELDVKVNQHIEEGWELQGGVATLTPPATMIEQIKPLFIQAVIKNDLELDSPLFPR